MAHFNREREITERYYNKVPLRAVYNMGKLIWEAITGFIFSKDGFALFSKDGFTLKCKDQ